MERVLVDDPEFLINVDTKWREHDRLFKDSVPKEEVRIDPCDEIDLSPHF